MLSERSTTWANSPPSCLSFSSSFSEYHLHFIYSSEQPKLQKILRSLKWNQDWTKGTSSQRCLRQQCDWYLRLCWGKEEKVTMGKKRVRGNILGFHCWLKRNQKLRTHVAKNGWKKIHAQGNRLLICSSFHPTLKCYPGEGNGPPTPVFCLVNPMDRAAWWVTESDTIEWLTLNCYLLWLL